MPAARPLAAPNSKILVPLIKVCASFRTENRASVDTKSHSRLHSLHRFDFTTVHVNWERHFSRRTAH